MIDFDGKGFFARLKQVNLNEFSSLLAPILVEGEAVVSTYKSIRDGVVFTNKRIIAINVQGLTGTKKDITSIPYSKISTYSLETAGAFDMDSELEIYLSGVGKVHFEFTGSTNVSSICKMISDFTLR